MSVETGAGLPLQLASIRELSLVEPSQVLMAIVLSFAFPIPFAHCNVADPRISHPYKKTPPVGIADGQARQDQMAHRCHDHPKKPRSEIDAPKARLVTALFRSDAVAGQPPAMVIFTRRISGQPVLVIA